MTLDLTNIFLFEGRAKQQYKTMLAICLLFILANKFPIWNSEMANFLTLSFLWRQKMVKFGFSSSIFCVRIIYFHVQLMIKTKSGIKYMDFLKNLFCLSTWRHSFKHNFWKVLLLWEGGLFFFSHKVAVYDTLYKTKITVVVSTMLKSEVRTYI
jgi:hypothetical protein